MNALQVAFRESTGRARGMSAAEYNAGKPASEHIQSLDTRRARARREIDPPNGTRRFDLCPSATARDADCAVWIAERRAQQHATRLLGQLGLSVDRPEADVRYGKHWHPRTLDAWVSCAETAELLGLVRRVNGSIFHLQITRTARTELESNP